MSQKKAKWTLRDIEVNSIEQLLAQPIPAFKETLKKLLIANNEEIARLTNLNKKILECLDQQDQKNGIGVSSSAGLQTPSKVSLIFFRRRFLRLNFKSFSHQLAGPNCRRKFGFECSRICQ
jgi:hypothetical protein